MEEPMKAFDAGVMFDCPEDAARGAEALQAAGYELAPSPVTAQFTRKIAP
jgi:hypothetical protein